MISLQGWVGELCENSDVEIMRNISMDIAQSENFSQHSRISSERPIVSIIYEEEDSGSASLESFLSCLHADVESYFSREMTIQRRKKIRNADLSLGVITKNIDPHLVVKYFPELTPKQQISKWFELHTKEVVAVDDKLMNGRMKVHPIRFVDPECDQDLHSIVFIRMGAHWILWLGMLVSEEVERLLLVFVRQLQAAFTENPIGQDSAHCQHHRYSNSFGYGPEDGDGAAGSFSGENELLSSARKSGIGGAIGRQLIHVERQGQERRLFRALFPLAPRQDGPLSLKATLTASSMGTTATESSMAGSTIPGRNGTRRIRVELFDEKEDDDDGEEREVEEEQAVNGRIHGEGVSGDSGKWSITERMRSGSLSVLGSVDPGFRNFYAFDWRGGSGGGMLASLSSSRDTADGSGLGLGVEVMVGPLNSPASYSLRFVTDEMLLLRPNLNIALEQRKELIDAAASEPAVLVGWQVQCLPDP